MIYEISALKPQIRSNPNRTKSSASRCKVRVGALVEIQACSYYEREINVKIKQNRGYGCVTFNYMKCLECGNDTNNPKFCNRRCSTIFNNKTSKTGFKRLMKEGIHPMTADAEYKLIIHRKICEKYWEMKCPICNWDKSVDVHHIDGNNENNDPRNLIPLCQNHHTLTRMKKYKKEMSETIYKLVNDKFGAIVQRQDMTMA